VQQSLTAGSNISAVGRFHPCLVPQTRPTIVVANVIKNGSTKQDRKEWAGSRYDVPKPDVLGELPDTRT
jgi:hypothetical protein